MAQREDNVLLDFVLWYALVDGAAATTVRSALYTVRHRQILEGYPDPLVGRPRLWLLLKKLKREERTVRRKYPVTAAMMKTIKGHLFGRQAADEAIRAKADVSVADAPAVWTGLVTAWMFLLRGANGYAATDAATTRLRS